MQQHAIYKQFCLCNVTPLEHDRVQCPPLQGRGGAGCKTTNGPQEPKETSKAVSGRPKFQKICPEPPWGTPLRAVSTELHHGTPCFPGAAFLGKGPELLVQILALCTPALPPEPLGALLSPENWWISPHLFPLPTSPMAPPYSYSLAFLAPSLLIDLIEESWVLYQSHTRPSGEGVTELILCSFQK